MLNGFSIPFFCNRTRKTTINGESRNSSFDGIEYINEQYDSDEMQVSSSFNEKIFILLSGRSMCDNKFLNLNFAGC